MSVWGAFLLGAGVVAVLSAAVHVFAGTRSRRPTWSLWRLGIGVALILATVGLGGSLASVHTEAPPEQLGVAVVVDGVSADRARGYDLGLFVSAHVTVASCAEAVVVRLTLEPTAEFWADHRVELRDGGHVDFGVPDDVDVHQVLRGQEGAVPLPRAGTGLEEQQRVSSRSEVVDGVTKISVDLPDWGRSLDPVTVVFEADWTQQRSRLGGCYVVLPALTGLPTVLTAARMMGQAWSDPADPPSTTDGAANLFRVSSTTPERYAYYDPEYEVTRGVTTIDVGDYAVDDRRSSPPPTSTIQGTAAWPCRSFISSLGLFSRDPDQAVPDYAFNPSSGVGAFSGSRMDAITGQPSCGSLLALEDAGYGTKRDLLLILIGAVFSVGVEVLLSAFRRRDRTEAAASED